MPDNRDMAATGIAYLGLEARWPKLDAQLGVIHGSDYLENGSDEAWDSMIEYTDRTLASLESKPDGTLKISELRYLTRRNGRNQWIPNDHTPLLWAQANLLRLLLIFESAAKKRNGLAA
jgi:hypothetical protein